MNEKPDDALLQKYADGNLSAAELQHLNGRQRDDAATRRQLIELLNLDSALAALSESDDTPLDAPLPTADRQQGKAYQRWPAARQGMQRLAVVACLLGLLATAWWWQMSARPWASVQSRVGAGELVVGAPLRGELYCIDEGIVQFVTARGAEVVMEAPAEFRLESVDRLVLTRGRVSVEVPSAAKGFSVLTPSGEAVDLGTRFGVDVPTVGPAEIHVFQGEVIAKASGSNAGNNLYGGDAVTMDRGASVARELRSAAFIESAEMRELTVGLASGQRQRSEAAIAAIRNDPNLIVALDFESQQSRPGVYRMSQGRWPGSRAPEFVNVGDHMQLDVGGDRDWKQLTLAAWVRLDRLGEPFQSLLHTNGWGGDKPGQVHWMVTRHSTMRLALYGNTLAPGSDEREWYPDSRTSVLPERGRWVHLATVYDSLDKTVRFYLNGRFDKQTRQAIAHPARLGPAQIGNWNNHDRKLSGRIDELILLGRAMNDGEIEALYAAGCPYRDASR